MRSSSTPCYYRHEEPATAQEWLLWSGEEGEDRGHSKHEGSCHVAQRAAYMASRETAEDQDGKNRRHTIRGRVGGSEADRNFSV